MDFAERKAALVRWVEDLQDEELVGLLEQVMDAQQGQGGDPWEELEEEERESIEAGLAELERGEGIPHEAVMIEMRGLIAEKDGIKS